MCVATAEAIRAELISALAGELDSAVEQLSRAQGRIVGMAEPQPPERPLAVSFGFVVANLSWTAQQSHTDPSALDWALSMTLLHRSPSQPEAPRLSNQAAAAVEAACALGGDAERWMAVSSSGRPLRRVELDCVDVLTEGTGGAEWAALPSHGVELPAADGPQDAAASPDSSASGSSPAELRGHAARTVRLGAPPFALRGRAWPGDAVSPALQFRASVGLVDAVTGVTLGPVFVDLRANLASDQQPSAKHGARHGVAQPAPRAASVLAAGGLSCSSTVSVAVPVPAPSSLRGRVPGSASDADEAGAACVSAMGSVASWRTFAAWNQAADGQGAAGSAGAGGRAGESRGKSVSHDAEQRASRADTGAAALHGHGGDSVHDGDAHRAGGASDGVGGGGAAGGRLEGALAGGSGARTQRAHARVEGTSGLCAPARDANDALKPNRARKRSASSSCSNSSSGAPEGLPKRSRAAAGRPSQDSGSAAAASPQATGAAAGAHASVRSPTARPGTDAAAARDDRTGAQDRLPSLGLLPGIVWGRLPPASRRERLAEAEEHLTASGIDVADGPRHRRVPVWDPIRSRVIAGDGAPKVKDAVRFFARFPYLSVHPAAAAEVAGKAQAAVPAPLPRGRAAGVSADQLLSEADAAASKRSRGVLLRVTKVKSSARGLDDEGEAEAIEVVQRFLQA